MPTLHGPQSFPDTQQNTDEANAIKPMNVQIACTCDLYFRDIIEGMTAQSFIYPIQETHII